MKLDENGQIVPTRVIDHMNFQIYGHVRHETSKQPSKAIPGQVMTLNEIVARYARGVPLPEGINMVFTDGGEYEGVDLSKMDRLDKQQYARDIREGIEDLRAELAKPAPAPPEPSIAAVPAASPSASDFDEKTV